MLVNLEQQKEAVEKLIANTALVEMAEAKSKDTLKARRPPRPTSRSGSGDGCVHLLGALGVREDGGEGDGHGG